MGENRITWKGVIKILPIFMLIKIKVEGNGLKNIA